MASNTCLLTEIHVFVQVIDTFLIYGLIAISKCSLSSKSSQNIMPTSARLSVKMEQSSSVVQAADVWVVPLPHGWVQTVRGLRGREAAWLG